MIKADGSKYSTFNVKHKTKDIGSLNAYYMLCMLLEYIVEM